MRATTTESGKATQNLAIIIKFNFNASPFSYPSNFCTIDFRCSGLALNSRE